MDIVKLFPVPPSVREFRRKKEQMERLHQSPEFKAKLNHGLSVKWSDPDYRQKMSELSKSNIAKNRERINQTCRTPESRQRKSIAASKVMATPEARQRARYQAIKRWELYRQRKSA